MKTPAERHEQFGRCPVAALHEAIADIERLQTEVEMLRGVGCSEDGDGVCIKCAKSNPVEAEMQQIKLNQLRERAAIFASAIASQRSIGQEEREGKEGPTDWQAIYDALDLTPWGEEDMFASKALRFNTWDGIERWAEVHAKIMNGEV